MREDGPPLSAGAALHLDPVTADCENAVGLWPKLSFAVHVACDDGSERRRRSSLLSAIGTRSVAGWRDYASMEQAECQNPYGE